MYTHFYMCLYIYIYIHRERKREREIKSYTYIYIYIYIYRYNYIYIYIPIYTFGCCTIPPCFLTTLPSTKHHFWYLWDLKQTLSKHINIICNELIVCCVVSVHHIEKTRQVNMEFRLGQKQLVKSASMQTHTF